MSPSAEITPEQVSDAVDKLDAYLKGSAFSAVSARAKVLRSSLEAATEDMNRALREAEAVMVARFKGHAAAIEFDDHAALLFWRLNKRWGLFILDGSGHLLPLQNASRQRRVEATGLLDDLAIQLQEEAKS